MNYKHYLVIDTETTGLDPEKGHEITQLSAMAIDAASLKPHSAGKFNVFIRPQRPELAEEGALKVAKGSYDKAMAEGIHPKVAAEKFVEFAERVNPNGKTFFKPIFTGWNVPFDWKFVNHLLFEHNVCTTEGERPFHYSSVDVMTMYFALLESDPDTSDFRMDTVLKRFGIVRKSDSHDAMEDVELCADLLRRGLHFYRRCRKSMQIVSPAEATKLLNTNA